MMLHRDIQHGTRIARAELVRSIRGYTRDTRRIIGLILLVLFFGGNLLFSLPTAYVLGRTARSVTAIPYFGVVAAVLPVLLLLLSVSRTVERISGVDGEELVLTTVHPRAVVLGLIGAEVGRLALWFGLPFAAFVTAFTLGLGSPTLLVTAGLVALPLVCWAAVWGYACGVGLLRALRRLPNVRRVLKVGSILVMIGFVVASSFVGQYVAEYEVSIQAVLSAVTFAPLTEYLALAFVGTSLAQATSMYAVGILVVLVGLTPVGLAVATRQASALWFTDAPQHETTSRASTSSGGLTPPRPFEWTKAGHVAWGFLVRTARHPQDLSHLMMLVFMLGPVGTTVVGASGDGLGPLLAGTGVGLGTYLAGAAFGLNPLGDDRPQLPLLLLTETPPRTTLHGRILAGLTLGVPIAVIVPFATMALGTGPLRATGFAVAGLGMCLTAGLFAVGIGAAYPIYEEREFWGTESVVPSTLVMMTYFFIVGGGTLIGLLVVWFAVTGSLELTAILTVGVGVYLLLTVGVSYGSYRYAIRRYRRYVVD